MIQSIVVSRLGALCMLVLALPSSASSGRTLQEPGVPARPSAVASSHTAVSAEALQRVAAVLVTAPKKSTESLGVQLAMLGSGELPALFETLRLGVVRVRDATGEEQVLPLSELQQQALFRALKHMLEPCRLYLRALSLSDREPTACRAAVRILGEVGDAEDLRMLLDLARPATPAKDATAAENPTAAKDATAAEHPTDSNDPAAANHPTDARDPAAANHPTDSNDPAAASHPTDAHAPTAAIAPQAASIPTAATATAPPTAPASVIDDEDASLFEATVERILRRDPRGFGQLETLFFRAHPQLLPLLVRSIANTGSLRAVEILARMLGNTAELDLLLMTGISRSASALVPPFDERIADAVRRCLDKDSEDLVREAALAAGKLEDSDAIPMLVTLLGHSNRGVRQNAHWALKRISGLRFGADPKCWTPWLEAEETWWIERAPQLFAEIDTAKLPESLAIIQEIARRRYPRHEIATELARALTHPDAEVRSLTCVALGQFRSRMAVPALMECLEDVDPEVRVQAGKALKAVTGENLPDHKASWVEAGY